MEKLYCYVCDCEEWHYIDEVGDQVVYTCIECHEPKFRERSEE